MKIQEGYLQCNVSNGMFTNEYAVEITLSGGGTASLFLDKGLVRVNGKEHSGYMPVNFLSNSKGKEITVLLPKEALEQGTRWVKVPSGHLQPK